MDQDRCSVKHASGDNHVSGTNEGTHSYYCVQVALSVYADSPDAAVWPAQGNRGFKRLGGLAVDLFR